jgi:hypothetical protein
VLILRNLETLFRILDGRGCDVTPYRPCWLIAWLALGVACAEPSPQARTAPYGGPSPDATRAAATARPGRTAVNAPLAAPEEVYREARDLVAQGRSDGALGLLQARVAHPREVSGAAAEENARLLAMLGELTAALRPATDESYQRAETYLAWAIAADPCMGEYWHVFMRVRLAHAGYAGVLAQLQHQEPLRYRTTDIGFSRNSTITLPWADYWLYLRGLLYAETHDAQRAVDSLLAFKRSRNTCPVDQTLGELYQFLRRPGDAVVYLKPASEEVPGRRSARRHYVLGLALKALKDTSGARRAFLESSLLDPSFDATRSELLALDWQMTGDRDSDIASTHRLLSEHPADLASWLTFWETRYRNGVTPEAEFQRFAGEVGNANLQLSQPAIAQTVSLLWEGKGEAAAGALARAAGAGADDADLWMATFLVAACRLDGGAAQHAFDALGHRDSDLYEALKRHGAVSLVSLLEAGGPAREDRLTRVGEVLASLNTDLIGGQLSAALTQACIHGVGKTPAGALAFDTAWVTDVLLLGQRVTVVEQRQTASEHQLALNRAQIRGLNAGALRTLARVTNLETEQIRQREGLLLLGDQVRNLEAAQAELAHKCAQEIQASEARLTGMINSNNERVQAALDELARELSRQGAKLDELARAAGATQQEVEQQRQRLKSLEHWRDQPPVKVTRDAGSLSAMLYKWSSVISIGPTVGFASLNVLGLLAAIADAAGS